MRCAVKLAVLRRLFPVGGASFKEEDEEVDEGETELVGSLDGFSPEDLFEFDRPENVLCCALFTFCTFLETVNKYFG